MGEIDFQSMLDNFATPSMESDPIKSIYDIIPCMDATQMHLLFQLTYFVEKYDLVDWRAVFSKIDAQLRSNKNISFMSSQNLKALLSAYTQNELVRGIKVQTLNTNNGMEVK